MEKLKSERGSLLLMDVAGDVIKDWTLYQANTFEELYLSVGSFSTSTLHITEPRTVRESVGAERGMEDGNQREEKKRMKVRA